MGDSSKGRSGPPRIPKWQTRLAFVALLVASLVIGFLFLAVEGIVRAAFR